MRPSILSIENEHIHRVVKGPRAAFNLSWSRGHDIWQRSFMSGNDSMPGTHVVGDTVWLVWSTNEIFMQLR